MLKREWFRARASIQRFEGGFASISVPVGNPLEFCITQFGRCHRRPVDDRSSYLQCAQIALSKSASRKISRRNRKLLLIKRSQVIGQRADLFQLRGSSSYGLADMGKRYEFGCGSDGAWLELVQRVSGAVVLSRRRAHSTVAHCRLCRSLKEPQLELIFLGECPGLDAAFAQIAGKLRGKTMEGEHAPRVYKINIANQVGVVRVIGERKSSVNLVAIDRIRIDCPATDYCDTFARNSFQHGRSICAGWADENLPRNIIRVVADVFAKRLAELLVNTRHLVNRAMQHRC